jgi:predicted house-cleaning noncanonical NTP pyrophosphatase (MazG superfamily)
VGITWVLPQSTGILPVWKTTQPKETIMAKWKNLTKENVNELSLDRIQEAAEFFIQEHNLEKLSFLLPCMHEQLREKIMSRFDKQRLMGRRTYKKFGDVTKAQEKYGVNSCKRSKYHQQPDWWKQAIREGRHN